MTGQEETSANNLSEDDLWKEKLHSGIFGVSKGVPLRTSSSFLLSIWLMMFPHVGLLLEVLFACSMSVWTCLPPGMCVYESERMRRAEGGPMVSLGVCVWSVTVFLSGYITSPWQGLEFLKRDPFSFFLFLGGGVG